MSLDGAELEMRPLCGGKTMADTGWGGGLGRREEGEQEAEE